MRKPFLVSWKRHTPWFTKFVFEKFFSLFYIINTQKSCIYKKLDTSGCYAKLRAISNLFSFFVTPCSIYIKVQTYRGHIQITAYSKNGLNTTEHTHNTAQHSTAQHSTAQHSTAQHSTAQHSTAQHSTAQHSTAQHTDLHYHVIYIRLK